MRNSYTEKLKKAEFTYDKKNYQKAKEIYTDILEAEEFESSTHEHKSIIYYNLALCHEFIAKEILSNQPQLALAELDSAKTNYDLSKTFSDDDLKSIKQIDYQLLQIFVVQIELNQSANNLEKVSEIIESALQCIHPYIQHLDDNFKKIFTHILDIKLNYLCKVADSILDKQNYEEAIKVYLKALECQEELLKLLKDAKALIQQNWIKADILFNLAQSNKKMMNYENALKLCSEAQILYKLVVDKDPQNKKALQDLKTTEESIQKLGEKIMKTGNDELTKKIDEHIFNKINSLSNGKEHPILLLEPHSATTDVVKATFDRVKELVGCQDSSQEVRSIGGKIYVYRECVKKLMSVVRTKSSEAKQNGHGAKLDQKKSIEELKKYLQELKEKEQALIKEEKEVRQNYKRKLIQSVLGSQDNALKIENKLVDYKNKRSKINP